MRWLSSEQFLVAPFAGAWIEIPEDKDAKMKELESLPSRERGLKCQDKSKDRKQYKSLPSRERGLKSL